MSDNYEVIVSWSSCAHSAQAGGIVYITSTLVYTLLWGICLLQMVPILGTIPSLGQQMRRAIVVIFLLLLLNMIYSLVVYPDEVIANTIALWPCDQAIALGLALAMNSRNSRYRRLASGE